MAPANQPGPAGARAVSGMQAAQEDGILIRSAAPVRRPEISTHGVESIKLHAPVSLRTGWRAKPLMGAASSQPQRVRYRVQFDQLLAECQRAVGQVSQSSAQLIERSTDR